MLNSHGKNLLKLLDVNRKFKSGQAHSTINYRACQAKSKLTSALEEKKEISKFSPLEISFILSNKPPFLTHFPKSESPAWSFLHTAAYRYR